VIQRLGRLPAPAEPLLGLLRFLVSGASEPETPLGPRLSEAIAALLGAPEWRVLAPLAAARLSETGAVRLLATEPAAALRRATLSAVAVAMTRQQVLVALGERAGRAGMPLMLLKGAALTGWIYPWSAPRLGADLDLLIGPADGERVCALLAGLAVEQDKFPGRSRLRGLAYERSFLVQAPVQVELDVHHGLAYPALYRIDYDGLWQRSVPHPGFGLMGLRVPGPEDMLLHLAIHALYDLKSWSRHDVDAALLIAHEPIVWARLSERAKQWGAAAGLFLLLERVAHGLGCPVPESVLSGLKPGGLTLAVARLALAGNDWEGLDTGPGALRLRQLAAQLWLTGGARPALRFQLDYAAARLLDALSRGK